MNEELEAISDKIRRGEPVGFLEAIAAIEYNERLRVEREAKSFAGRLKRFFRATPPTKEPAP